MLALYHTHLFSEHPLWLVSSSYYLYFLSELYVNLCISVSVRRLKLGNTPILLVGLAFLEVGHH